MDDVKSRRTDPIDASTAAAEDAEAPTRQPRLGRGRPGQKSQNSMPIILLELDRSGIRVASYLTDLPPRPLLQKKLHDAVVLARLRLEARPASGAGPVPTACMTNVE